ncbi:MAG: ABC transporter permease [Nanoarchaeota archaeon]
MAKERIKMLKDYFKISWREIRRRKLRSWLTLIGIIIGIAAIISLISLGQGLQNAIERQFSNLGKDKLIITAKGNTLGAGLSIDAVKITDDDLEVVRSVSGVKTATGYIYSSPKMEYNDIVRYFYVSGIPTNDEERSLIEHAQAYTLVKGRSLQDGDKYKAVMGYDYLQPELFEKEIGLGSKILIDVIEFKVVGFYSKVGNPVDDKIVYIPLETYQEIFDKPKEVGIIIIQAQPGENLDLLAETLNNELRKSRKLEEGKEDLNIQTPQQLVSSFQTILDIVQVVLIGIAAISLLVGGIGIMNTMFTSVLERTKEIGIMKAIGARNRHIMVLFLVESGLYGFGGGIIGVILGICFAKLAQVIASQYIGTSFLDVRISWLLILGTLLFSFVIGCLSGIAPARRASRLNPVESLRYE